jgi:hypothetical protein
LIVLNERASDAEIAQALVVKSLAEPSAVVDMTLGHDDERQGRYWIGRSAHEVKPAEDVVSLAAASQHCRDARHGDKDGLRPHDAVFFRLFK